MKRIEFLKSFGILSLGAMTSSYGIPLDFNSEKNLKEITREILKGINFKDYSGVSIDPSRNYLKGKGIEYVVNSSLKVLEGAPLGAQGNLELNLTPELFRQIVNPFPYFSLPLTSKILNKFIQDEGEIGAFSKINKKGLEQGLWFGDTLNEDQGDGHFSIPYFGPNKIIFYAEGEKWGVKGNFVGLIQYKGNNSGIKTKTYCFLKAEATNFVSDAALSLFGGNVVENANEGVMKIQKSSETLMKILRPNTLTKIKENYSKEECEWLERLVEMKRKRR